MLSPYNLISKHQTLLTINTPSLYNLKNYNIKTNLNTSNFKKNFNTSKPNKKNHKHTKQKH